MSYEQSKKEFLSIDLSEMRPSGFLQTILNRQENNSKTVTSKHGWEIRGNCPLCKSLNREYQFEKFDIDLFQCIDCGTAYFDKIPQNPDDIYSAPHALGDAKKGYLENKDYRKIRFAEERIDLIKSNLTEGDTKGLNILDVGCGTGWFLEVAKEKGFNSFGLELGRELAKFTSERLDIPVWNCELKDLKTETKFDVITMFDLIEHVKDPAELILAAKQHLSNNGIIVIFTPHFDSLAIKVMKAESNLIMPAEHLSYFTEGSIKSLSALSGMELIYFKTKGIDVGDLKSYYEFKGELELKKACENLYDIIQPVIDASESGNHLRAILRK